MQFQASAGGFRRRLLQCLALKYRSFFQVLRYTRMSAGCHSDGPQEPADGCASVWTRRAGLVHLFLLGTLIRLGLFFGFIYSAGGGAVSGDYNLSLAYSMLPAKPDGYSPFWPLKCLS